jgi:hypothetical protein
MADNVHWLRDTYGPALRAFYADLLKQPVPQKFIDLIAGLEAPPDAASQPLAADGSRPVVTQPHEPQPDTSD